MSPVVKQKVEEFAAKINEVIQEEKLLMERDLKLLEAQNLSTRVLDHQKKQIADAYSEKIDARINALGFDLDALIEKQVRYSLLNNDATSEAEIRKQLLLKFRATKNFTGYYSYGVLGLTNNLPDNELDKNIGYSNNIEFGLKFNYQLSRTSPWGITSGLGFSWRTLRLDNDMIFLKAEDQNISIAKYPGEIEKSKLRTGYIMVPLGMQYNFSKLQNAGMDVQYRSYSKGLRVAANMYAGVKMSSNNIVKGTAENYRERANYDVNPLIYGAQITFSYNDFSIFVKKDFSNFFKQGSFNNDKALVVGLAMGL